MRRNVCIKHCHWPHGLLWLWLHAARTWLTKSNNADPGLETAERRVVQKFLRIAPLNIFSQEKMIFYGYSY
jgi:hypothetical protein